MNLHKDSIIGEIVAYDYRMASVFKNASIDFCCQGNRSIETACVNTSTNANEIITQLMAIETANMPQTVDFQSWSIDLLVDYIERQHHKYVDRKILEIQPYLDKICRVHGDKHPELFEIKELFQESADDLTTHMRKEEIILFPYIKKIVHLKKSNNATATHPSFSVIKNPIAMMQSEHEDEGERHRKIAALSNNYTLPEDGCTTYGITLSLLKEFEDDLHLHIHLENNILFPKAIELEQMIQ